MRQEFGRDIISVVLNNKLNCGWKTSRSTERFAKSELYQAGYRSKVSAK